MKKWLGWSRDDQIRKERMYDAFQTNAKDFEILLRNHKGELIDFEGYYEKDNVLYQPETNLGMGQGVSAGRSRAMKTWTRTSLMVWLRVLHNQR